MEIAILVLVAIFAGIVILSNRKKEPATTPPVKPRIVTTPNNPPIVLDPFLPRGTGRQVIWNELITFDWRHRTKGCDASGAPVDEYGAYDADGDALEYKITARGPSVGGGASQKYAVYSMSSKNRIDGEWIEAGSDDIPIGIKNSKTGELEAIPLFGLVVGCDDEVSPAVVQVASKSCGDRPPVVEVPSITGVSLGTLTVTLTVRDTKRAAAATAMSFSVYRGCV